MMNDTICALSTAAGSGAIALIRLSGNEAVNICNAVFTSVKKNFQLLQAEPSKAYFGKIMDDNAIIDEVLVTVFRAPYSYTGEDTAEIACHGSTYIQQKILHLLIKNGARVAEPGEYTRRAYLNGKMDLSQAEAVGDLIASSGAIAHQVAMNQMRGGISNELHALRADLLQFIALIELELDFSEEEVEFADRTKLNQLIIKILGIIEKLIQSFELGNAIKNGIPVAIVGEPNVGKSTLLNAILNEEKAIVSEIAGTTRDVVEDTFNIDGITYRFIDTAGLRETTDIIENLGIERTYKKLEQAKIVLALFDLSDNLEKVETTLKSLAEKAGDGKQFIVVMNKADKINAEVPKLNAGFEHQVVVLSALEKTNIDQLMSLIKKASHTDLLDNNEVIITNARHIDALTRAHEALTRAHNGLHSGISNDFLAMDIREVIHHLAGITGEEITTDEVLGHIFGQFCIGK